jgi:hypothetical protein
MDESQFNQELQELYHKTTILRKPISGIVSGYHVLPYILIAPDDENSSHSIEINGTINVSPKFIISPGMMNETFGDVFDAETFDKQLEGRFFSFTYTGRKNIKLQNDSFKIEHFEESLDDRINRVTDILMQQENTKTGLISCPRFHYYPVSLDKFISEILDREFRV